MTLCFFVCLSFVVIFCLSNTCPGISDKEQELFENVLMYIYNRVPKSKGDFINSGTPDAIKNDFDCDIRNYSYEYSKQLQSNPYYWNTFYDALQLHACNITAPKIIDRIPPEPYISSTNNCTYYISPNGNDSNNGLNITNPLLTIEKSLEIIRAMRKMGQTETCIINLLEGTYYLNDTILLTPNDSFITIQNYNQKEVIISGGFKLEFEGEWELDEPYMDYKWYMYKNMNNLYDRLPLESNKSNDLVEWIGLYNNYTECLNEVKTYQNKHNIKFHSFTWFNDTTSHNSKYYKGCYGIKDVSWQPIIEDNIYSGRLIGRNVFKRKVSNYNKLNNNQMNGLRINGKRCIRARYPDSDPQISMQYEALSGWIRYKTEWIPPQNDTNDDTVDVQITNSDYPNVYWPSEGFDGACVTGEGNWGNFTLGINGSCKVLEIPVGYWCQTHPPRGNYQLRAPSGMYISEKYGLNLPYKNATNAVITAFNDAQWFNWIWNVSNIENNSKITFDFGFQGAQGSNKGSFWFIENVYEELTMPNEYYYDQENHMLYYYYNATDLTKPSPPPNDTVFVATNNKVLFNFSGDHINQNGDSIKNVTISGITLVDTAYSYLDEHILPSGGDWSIPKSGCIYIQGSENVVLNDLLFSNLDSTAIFVYGYNRNLTIQHSEFTWLGTSAIISLGYSEGLEDIAPGYGPDGRNGNQPRYNTIRNNICHEIGIYQKQSSCYFQALSALTTIHDNIFFNGPRAAINFNDGFGGNNSIYSNLIFNQVRQTIDHGLFNSWDRQPYISKIRNGVDSSVLHGDTNIHNNMFLGTYNTETCIDTDGGSSFYNVYNNIFVYGLFGLKSDIGGHDHKQYNNIYLYTQVDSKFMFGVAGYNDEFKNNTCIYNSNGVYTSNCKSKYNGNGASNLLFENNSVYMPFPELFTIPNCTNDFKQWQNNGNDKGTVLRSSLLLNNQQILKWCDQVLSHETKRS